MLRARWVKWFILLAFLIAGGWFSWWIYPIHFGLSGNGVVVDANLRGLADPRIRVLDSGKVFPEDSGQSPTTRRAKTPIPFSGVVYIFLDNPNTDQLIPGLRYSNGPVELDSQWNGLNTLRAGVDNQYKFYFRSDEASQARAYLPINTIWSNPKMAIGS